ncbi:MAG: hypothetical protein LBT40_13085 [Deltaproteobacteria bacterium]|jgi:tetratricopeptide (TPR) repeat protein|nr:hypothetical protein [Deltaproteobacteria bacterium]
MSQPAPASLAGRTFISIILAAGDLLAAARKPGRAGGGPACSPPGDGDREGRNVRDGHDRDRQGQDRDFEKKAEEEKVDSAMDTKGRDRQGQDRDGEKKAEEENVDSGMNTKGRDGTVPKAADGDGPVTPEFPEVPAWGFLSAGETLDLVTDTAEKLSRETGARFQDRSLLWEFARSLALVTLGPADPRVWAAASRAALAMSGIPGKLEASAALAAGAAEGMSRAAADAAASDRAEDGGRQRAEESRFALAALAAVRAKLAAAPGRDPGRPFPAPAYSAETALYPPPEAAAPDPPGPAGLREALAGAERASGAGSREALVARSRLGGAVADEEAWSGVPGSAGAPGEAPAGELLRSASGGLDAILGREHPDSLDARWRLARFLAGGSGPGIPPDPFPCEIPPEKDLEEAARLFLEIAAARAEAAPGRSLDGDAGKPQAGETGRPGDGPEGIVRFLRQAVAAPMPEPQTRLLGLLRRVTDGSFPVAAAAALECERLLWRSGRGERESVFLLASGAARTAPGSSSPVTRRLSTCLAELMADCGEWEIACETMADAAVSLKRELGACSGEAAAAAFRAAALRMRADSGDLPRAVCLCAEAAATLERTGFRAGPPDTGPPPRRAITPDRRGRDVLAARLLLAEGIAEWRNDHVTALDALGPFLDALPDLPESRKGPGSWPWPPELAGRALAAAGRAAFNLRDFPGAEDLLRRALDTLDPEPPDAACLRAALGTLVRALERRATGNRAVCRELAALTARGAEIAFRAEGPDSLDALTGLSESARWHEEAGDPRTAYALYEKLEKDSSRLLGHFAKQTREFDEARWRLRAVVREY